VAEVTEAFCGCLSYGTPVCGIPCHRLAVQFDGMPQYVNDIPDASSSSNGNLATRVLGHIPQHTNGALGHVCAAGV